MTQGLVDLSGQWFGRIDGTNEGFAVLNIDRDRPTVGHLHVWDSQVPFNAMAEFSTGDGALVGALREYSAPNLPSGAQLPKEGKFNVTAQELERLEGSWETDLGTSGRFWLERRDVPVNSGPDVTMTWKEFRDYALSCAGKHDLLFRGQGDARDCLVTSFHRTGRRNMLRYAGEDIPALCRLVEATIDDRFNLNDATEHGSLVGLGQHHGFPTPLLDWTESPFVAAFFAFARLPKLGLENWRQVRIYQFDLTLWPPPYGRLASILEIGPRFAPLYLRALRNRRVLPQQSVHMFSNVVDIDGLIRSVERETGRKVLTRINIAGSERAVAMAELGIMGINDASLFPGLEGLCRALGENRF